MISKRLKTRDTLCWATLIDGLVALYWKHRSPGAKANQTAVFAREAWPVLHSDQWWYLLSLTSLEFKREIDRWQQCLWELLPSDLPTHTIFYEEFPEQGLPKEFETMELTPEILDLLTQWQTTAEAEQAAQLTLAQAEYEATQARLNLLRAQIHTTKLRWMLDYLKLQGQSAQEN